VFDLRFFTKFFILQQCLDPYPNPNFFSDSAKTFGFFRIGIHNTGKHAAMPLLMNGTGTGNEGSFSEIAHRNIAKFSQIN
jgi:hypothetical protein